MPREAAVNKHDARTATWLLRSTPRVVVRPALWRTALRFIAWPPWRSWTYLKFRHETVYGNTWGNGSDVVPFLRWAKSYRKEFSHHD
jgi:hypothetical protein